MTEAEQVDKSFLSLNSVKTKIKKHIRIGRAGVMPENKLGNSEFSWLKSVDCVW